MEFFNYRGIKGSAEVSISDQCLHGKLWVKRDLVTYQGRDVSELEAAFQEAVDDYLLTVDELGLEMPIVAQADDDYAVRVKG